MTAKVLCLRPEQDFLKVGVTPPTDLSICYGAPSDIDLSEAIKNVRALVIPAVGPKLPSFLFTGSDIELIQVTGAGVDRLDEAAVRSLEIPVANVPGGSNAAVAEYTVASVLFLLRRIGWAQHEIHHDRYIECRTQMISECVPGLVGLTAGIIGFGNIGLAVAKAFQGMGSNIVFYDPQPADPTAAEHLGARRVTLDELLQTADIVTLHVPLIPATEGLISGAELAQMKSTAILINAARGGIVDEAALAEALASGTLGGAVVDVYSEEPPLKSNPLLQLDKEVAQRVLLTPHIAGVTRQAWAYLFRTAWENVLRVLNDGEQPLNRVY